jgi:hypothetical protein
MGCSLKRVPLIITILLALAIMSAPQAHGLAFVTDGNEPLDSNSYDPWKGILSVINHKTRFYHVWINGSERFYYRGDTTVLNDTLDKFAAVDAHVHEVRLLPGPSKQSPLDGEPIVCNWYLHLATGLARAGNNFEADPILTVLVGGSIELDKIKILNGVTLLDHGDLTQEYLEQLKSTDTEARGYAAYCLVNLAPHQDRTINTVTVLLNHSNAGVRAAAAKALSGFGKQAKSALGLLTKRLLDQNESVRAESQEAINKIEAAKDTMSPQERTEHQAMLGKIGEFVEAHRAARKAQSPQKATGPLPTEPPKGSIIVYPYFSPALDGPEFIVEYVNTAAEPVDLTELLATKSIILDGKEYPRQVIKFAGNAILKPGRTWKHRIALSAFLASAQQLKYSQKLKRWRWKIPLDKDRHTLIVNFAGQQCRPIDFQWEADEPFLYE